MKPRARDWVRCVNGMFVSERCGDGDMVVGRMYAELTDEDRNKLAAAG